MKKILILLLLLQSTITFAQKSYILQLKNNENLTIKVQRYGCIATDPSNFYYIKITKIDSTFLLEYSYKNKFISKKVNQKTIQTLVNFETTKKMGPLEYSTAYNFVIFSKLGKKKRFKTFIDADKEIISKYFSD